MTLRTLRQPMQKQAKSHAASWCVQSVASKRSYLGLDLTPATASVSEIRFAANQNPEAGT